MPGWGTRRYCRGVRRLIAGLVAVLAVQCLRCGGDETPATLPDALFQGDASDEAFERFWPKVAEATASTAMGAMLATPAPGATVTATMPATLVWRRADAALPTPGGPVRLATRAGWFGLPVAHAHLPPVTAHVYLVELRAGSAEPVRLFTTATEWAVDGVTWQSLIDAGGDVRVTIYNAYLNQNVVEEGPFVTPEVTFTIGS